jgi:hypothetical protein
MSWGNAVPGKFEDAVTWVAGLPWKYLCSAVILVAILIGVNVWVWVPEIKYIESAAKDTFEQQVDGTIKLNLIDIFRWYRANIAIQGLLLLFSVTAAILAAVTTKDNANKMKLFSVVLTALMAALTAGQATFHIRENIEVFIKANTDLQLLETDYIIQREALARAGSEQREALASAASEKDKIADKLDYLRSGKKADFLKIQTARMRAYAVIGQPPSLTPPGGGDQAPAGVRAGAETPASPPEIAPPMLKTEHK